MAPSRRPPHNRAVTTTYLPLLAGVILFFAVLAARYFAEASKPAHQRRPSSWSNRLKLAKILVGAAMALYAISASLHNLGDKLVP